MTPTNETTPIDITGIAVAVGRIEEKLTAMSEKESRTDDRLGRVEDRLTNIELSMATHVRPKAPWWVVVAGVGAAVILGINGIDLLNTLLN